MLIFLLSILVFYFLLIYIILFFPILARQLKEMGQTGAAAQLYLSVDSVRDAIDILMEARDWVRARKIAQELEPDYYPRVESAYREWLRSEGRADQLADVDLGGALEMLAGQGQWDQVLQKAQKHGPELLNKYVNYLQNHYPNN